MGRSSFPIVVGEMFIFEDFSVDRLGRENGRKESGVLLRRVYKVVGNTFSLAKDSSFAFVSVNVGVFFSVSLWLLDPLLFSRDAADQSRPRPMASQDCEIDSIP